MRNASTLGALLLTTPILAALLGGSAAPIDAAPEVRRARPNPVWLETQALREQVRQAVQATPADLAEQERRYAPLAAEQQRLIAEARRLDAEEEWLVAANAQIEELKRRFGTRCDPVDTEEELRECQALVDQVNRAVEAYNARYHPFAAASQGFNDEVRAWMERLREMQAWQRTILARPPPAAVDRRALEQERERLRGEVDGLEEALRRLSATEESAQQERADWEGRWRDAVKSSWQRVRDLLADQAVELGQKAIARRAEGITKEIQDAIDQRINAAGGNAPDKADQVKRWEEVIRRLGAERTEVLEGGERLGRGWTVVKQTAEGLGDAPASEDLERLAGLANDLLGDPAVQRALKLSSAPAAVFTWGKLIADSSLDVTTELLAWRRVAQLNRGSEAFLAAVATLDEKLKKKVARIQEIGRILGDR